MAVALTGMGSHSDSGSGDDCAPHKPPPPRYEDVADTQPLLPPPEDAAGTRQRRRSRPPPPPRTKNTYTPLSLCVDILWGLSILVVVALLVAVPMLAGSLHMCLTTPPPEPPRMPHDAARALGAFCNTYSSVCFMPAPGDADARCPPNTTAALVLVYYNSHMPCDWCWRDEDDTPLVLTPEPPARTLPLAWRAIATGAVDSVGGADVLRGVAGWDQWEYRTEHRPRAACVGRDERLYLMDVVRAEFAAPVRFDPGHVSLALGTFRVEACSCSVNPHTGCTERCVRQSVHGGHWVHPHV